MAHADSGNFTVQVTGYSGHEEMVIAVSGAARENPQTRGHADWRYERLPGAPEPRIFWLCPRDAPPVGMVGLCYRPYWVDGTLKFVAVLGDISLEAVFRGQGLGKKLYREVNAWIESHEPGIGLVLPNTPARKGLEACGWEFAERRIPWVYVVNPRRRLSPFVGAGLARVLGELWRRRCLRRTAGSCTHEISHEVCSGFDPWFDEFWRERGKGGRIVRDRGVASLSWRYSRHPGRRFEIVRFLRGGVWIGYLVAAADEGDIQLFECESLDETFTPAILTYWLRRVAETANVEFVRTIVNEHNPVGAALRAAGFVPRAEAGVLGTLVGRGSPARAQCVWCLTPGDKDV